MDAISSYKFVLYNWSRLMATSSWSNHFEKGEITVLLLKHLKHVFVSYKEFDEERFSILQIILIGFPLDEQKLIMWWLMKRTEGGGNMALALKVESRARQYFNSIRKCIWPLAPVSPFKVKGSFSGGASMIQNMETSILCTSFPVLDRDRFATILRISPPPSPPPSPSPSPSPTPYYSPSQSSFRDKLINTPHSPDTPTTHLWACLSACGYWLFDGIWELISDAGQFAFMVYRLAMVFINGINTVIYWVYRAVVRTLYDIFLLLLIMASIFLGVSLLAHLKPTLLAKFVFLAYPGYCSALSTLSSIC